MISEIPLSDHVQATLSDILRQLGMIHFFFVFFKMLDETLLWSSFVHVLLIPASVTKLGTHFGVDLMHRKAEVKDIITDVINSMSDEEEEEEADENAEAGGDADKDGDDEDEDDDA